MIVLFLYSVLTIPSAEQQAPGIHLKPKARMGSPRFYPIFAEGRSTLSNWKVLWAFPPYFNLLGI